MLHKLKNGFIGFMCVLWVTEVWLISTMSHSDLGGTELNGFLAFILWIVSIYLIMRGKAITSAVGSTVILFIIRIAKFGVDTGALEKLKEPIVILGACLVLGKLFWGAIKNAEDEAEAKRKRKKNAKDRGEVCCSRCGSVSVQYYALGIPYKGYASTYRSNKHYHCNNCGREW